MGYNFPDVGGNVFLTNLRECHISTRVLGAKNMNPKGIFINNKVPSQLHNIILIEEVDIPKTKTIFSLGLQMVSTK